MSRSLPLFLSLIPPFILFLSLPFFFFFFFIKEINTAGLGPAFGPSRSRPAKGRRPWKQGRPNAAGLWPALGGKAAGLVPALSRPFSPSTPPSKIIIQSPQFRIPNPPTSNYNIPILQNASTTLLNSNYIPTTAKTRSKHRKTRNHTLDLQEHQQSQTPKPSVLINRSSNQTTINDPRINKHERLRYLLRFRIKNAEELRLIHYTSSFKTYEIRTP